ncbi:MAG: hypothetical protein PQJ45_10795 [Sphaerochaetaceae bacterium]|nr:hypothetical protein [Sphaerochaetaceae bacterium]
MKKNVLFVFLVLITVVFFSACQLNVDNDFDTLPSYLIDTLYFNYDSDSGTVEISNDEINVVEGTTPNDYYEDGVELDTSTLNDDGYSIETTYTDESDESTPEGEFEATLTMVCTKTDSPTITFEFEIYYPYDIWVTKYVDGVEDEDWESILTWDDF